MRYLHVLFIFALIGPGCAGANGIVTAKDPTEGDVIAGERLQVLRSELTGDGKSARGCLVEVKNATDRKVQIEYRIRWYSVEDREIRRKPLKWDVVELGPGSNDLLVSTAPAGWCTRYEIDFREPPTQP